MSQISLAKTNSNFACDISLNKDKYLEGEDITVSVTIKNVSNKVDSLAQLNSSEVLISLGITNEKGEPAQYKGVISDYIRATYTIIQPGETKGFSVRIMEDFGYEKILKDYHCCSMNYYFPRGNYSIQYNDGSIISKTIQFNVEKPNDNESAAWEGLKSIYAKDQDIKMKALTLIDFAHYYKGSVYSEAAFYLASRNISPSINGWLIDENYIENCKWFIDAYPNSMYISNIVWDCAYSIGHLTNNKYSINNFLDKIITDYPGTSASISANSYLTYDFLK